MGERMFPVLMDDKVHGVSRGRLPIPWELAELAYREYMALHGNGQSLERLAERGGFYASEMDELLPEWRSQIDPVVQLRDERDAALARLRDVELAADDLMQALNKAYGTPAWVQLPAAERPWLVLRSLIGYE